MKTLFDTNQINDLIRNLAEQIKSDIPTDTQLAVIGIRSRGEILAHRLTEMLEGTLHSDILSGTLDITLYRDDLNEPKQTQPTVRSTEIDFDLNDKVILLVDDVLHTGRSVRAAMDALHDLGRPRLMRLAVLVDRGHREYPICADYIAAKVDVDVAHKVRVHLMESDNEDCVIESDD